MLITNRKSHMGFRLVPKSVTLNDLERRNERYVAVASWSHYVNVVEDRPIQSNLINLDFAIYHL